MKLPKQQTTVFKIRQAKTEKQIMVYLKMAETTPKARERKRKELELKNSSARGRR